MNDGWASYPAEALVLWYGPQRHLMARKQMNDVHTALFPKPESQPMGQSSPTPALGIPVIYISSCNKKDLKQAAVTV